MLPELDAGALLVGCFCANFAITFRGLLVLWLWLRLLCVLSQDDGSTRRYATEALLMSYLELAVDELRES